MKYAYQRAGGPLLSWRNQAPSQSRAADATALGSLGGTTLDGPTILPAPGAPEPIGVSLTSSFAGLAGCSCSGSCGCGPAVSGFDSKTAKITAVVAAVGVFAWLALRRR